MCDRKQRLKSNLEQVQQRIAAAAEASGRAPGDVTLVAVTKYVDADITRELVEVGAHALGENRPQTFWPKAEALADLDIQWHQIGHLQRNKLRRTLPYLSLLHSVDSVRLMDAVDRIQEELDPDHPMPFLLEVNISGDEAKHGLKPDDVAAAIEAAAAKKHARLRGLMCMAGYGTTSDEARRDFAALRELRDQLQARYPAQELAELSMGMSGDFEQAIAEGATLVRVGSLLFEGIQQ